MKYQYSATNKKISVPLLRKPVRQGNKAAEKAAGAKAEAKSENGAKRSRSQDRRRNEPGGR